MTETVRVWLPMHVILNDDGPNPIWYFIGQFRAPADNVQVWVHPDTSGSGQALLHVEMKHYGADIGSGMLWDQDGEWRGQVTEYGFVWDVTGKASGYSSLTDHRELLFSEPGTGGK